MTAFRPLLTRLAIGLTGLYALDRLGKLIATEYYFRRTPPPTPPTWPSVTMLHPITHVTEGHSGLACEHRYLRNPVPLSPRHWWLLPLVALLLPLQSTAALLFGNGEVEWQGQRLRIATGGRFERLP